MTNQGPLTNSNRLLEANRDILDRIQQFGMDVIYDDVLDTVFIEIGGPKKAFNVPIDEDIMLRIDPTTMEVVAAEIPLYLAGVVRDRPRLAKLVDELGVHTRRECSRSLPPAKAKKVGRLLQSWINTLAAN